MAVEERQQNDAEPTAKKSTKKPLLYAGAFLIGFFLTAALNYYQLKLSYVPPPEAPPHGEEEERKPVLRIDLGQAQALEDSAATEIPEEEQLAEAPPPTDSTSAADSLQRAIQELTAAARMKDSLLSAMRTELDQSKKAAQKQVAPPDSADVKKPAKLAKIVENMPAADAAKMLEPLTDDIVIDILLRIKQRQAAKIMAALPSARAARLSDRIMQPIVQR